MALGQAGYVDVCKTFVNWFDSSRRLNKTVGNGRMAPYN